MAVEQDQHKTTFQKLFTHQLSLVVIGAVLTYAIPKGFHIWEARSQAEQDFQLAIKNMEADIDNHDTAGFVTRAKDFRRAMQTETVPSKYNLSADMFSGKGDIAGLAQDASQAVNSYLSDCQSGLATYDQKQKDQDCQSELESYVLDALRELDRRIDIDRIT